jgi:hypothetical protein
MDTTLAGMKPSYRAWHITAEYRGMRYFITHAIGLYAAEEVALDYVAAYPDARFFTGDVYGSTTINGNAQDLRRAVEAHNQITETA